VKAVVYKRPRHVVVKKVPDAKIEKATDVLVKITTTNICGSDLHMYEGRTSMETVLPVIAIALCVLLLLAVSACGSVW
jgi:threonine dehydrogenase-like Zn-dependent dehydrogenase